LLFNDYFKNFNDYYQPRSRAQPGLNAVFGLEEGVNDRIAYRSLIKSCSLIIGGVLFFVPIDNLIIVPALGHRESEGL
jgi:hypothetical protein